MERASVISVGTELGISALMVVIGVVFLCCR
jgi:hypothetical protein